MVVRAIGCDEKEYIMFDDIDSFKFSYDDHESIHFSSKGGKLTIYSEEGPFVKSFGNVSRYEVNIEDDKNVRITQVDSDVWEVEEY